MQKISKGAPNNYLVFAIITIIVIFAAAMFLKTDFGRGITGIDIGGMFSNADQKKLKKSKNKIQDHYIVVLEDNTQDVGAVADELAAATTGEVKHKYDKKVLNGFAAKLPEAQVEKLLNDKRVRYVEEDAKMEPATITQTGATLGLDRIDQRALPLNSTYNYDVTGEGVNAYIIDSGIRTTHTDFGGRARFGADFSADNNSANQGIDCSGHGTHVAGTIGSSTYGVAKRVNLYAAKVTDCSGSIYMSSIIAAVSWLTTHKGNNPAVANISIISSGPAVSLDEAINNSMAAGVTYALAAGNFGLNACAYSPARVPNAITVGSMVPDSNTNKDYIMGYSNIGSCLDLFAPGNGIISLSSADDTSARMLSGTSMAAPHVAGVAALYLETHRSASASEVRNAIVNSATTGTLNPINPTVPIDPTTPNKLLYSFLTAGIPDPPPPPPPPPTSSCTGTTYAGTVGTGAINYHTSGGFAGRAGLYNGVLTPSNGGQAALVLERKQGKSWTPQSTATGATGTLNLTYNGTKGSYRWKVVGTTQTIYTLCSKLP